ncbi:hypothetical protein AB0756_39535 [Tolypothrix campylonemoides VB511288_2]|uniref:Uncharacterized protein n=2 Tax=Nostocales TaxID=1161 RepID=A0ABW8WJZ8_9CYAN
MDWVSGVDRNNFSGCTVTLLISLIDSQLFLRASTRKMIGLISGVIMLLVVVDVVP